MSIALKRCTILLLLTGIGNDAQIKIANPGKPTLVYNFLAEVIYQSRSSGSLIERGICGANSEIYSPIERSPGGPFDNADQAFSALSAMRPGFIVRREQGRKYRLYDVGVDDKVLNVNLKEFDLSDNGDLDDAIAQLRLNSGFKYILTSLGIDLGITFNSLSSEQHRPVRGRVIFKDKSIREILDAMVGLDHGFWVYEECQVTASKKRITLKAIPIP